MKKINQSGIIALWILGLILVGVVTGTYLVQNGINFLPQASEFNEVLGETDESGQNCEVVQGGDARCDGTTYINEFWAIREDACRKVTYTQTDAPNCGYTAPTPEQPTSQEEGPQNSQQPPQESSDNPIAPPPPEINNGVSASQISNCQDEACKNKACEADKVIYCDNRDGRPRAIRKTGGYFDSSTGKCVFDFFEVPEKNSECGKSESKSGDVVSVTADEERRIDQNRSSTQASRSQGGSSSTSSSSAACSTDPKINSATETSFKDAKVANNLVRFYSILEGLPSMCVPADLGVGNQEKASAGGKEGRLMLCSGADSTLTWRVIIDNKLVVPDNKPAPQKDQIITGFTESGKLKAARIAAGLENP
jgi:hypothetical protein